MRLSDSTKRYVSIEISFPKKYWFLLEIWPNCKWFNIFHFSAMVDGPYFVSGRDIRGDLTKFSLFRTPQELEKEYISNKDLCIVYIKENCIILLTIIRGQSKIDPKLLYFISNLKWSDYLISHWPHLKIWVFEPYYLSSKSMEWLNINSKNCYSCGTYFEIFSPFGSKFIDYKHYFSCYMFFKQRKRDFFLNFVLNPFKDSY